MVKYPHGWDSLLLMLHISWLFVMLEATRSLSNLVTMSLPREIPGKNCKAGEIRFWCLSNDPASLLSFPCRLYLSLIPQQSPPIIPTQACLPHLSLPTEPSSSGSHFIWHCCQLAPISTRWANQLHLKLWDAAVVPSTTKELQVSKTWSSSSASLECGGDVQTTALIPKQSFLLFSRVLVVYLGKQGDFVGRHSSVTHVASTCVSHCMAVGTIHFVLSCGFESKDMNPLTAIVIPLHEREVGELCVSKGSVYFLWTPESCSVKTIQSYVDKSRKLKYTWEDLKTIS